jgi:hypothetical protein
MTITSPPMSELDHSPRELLAQWREGIFWFWGILEEDAERNELSKTIREDFGIGISYTASDLSIGNRSIINCLKDK